MPGHKKEDHYYTLGGAAVTNYISHNAKGTIVLNGWDCRGLWEGALRLGLGAHLHYQSITSWSLEWLLSSSPAGKPAFKQRMQPMAAVLICVLRLGGPCCQNTIGQRGDSRTHIVVLMQEFAGFFLFNPLYTQLCCSCECVWQTRSQVASHSK